MHTLNKKVFFPTLGLFLFTIGYSLIDNEGLLVFTQQINTWILTHIGWLFSWSTLLFLVVLTGIYFSPFGKTKIGGTEAQPILTKWQWFTITLCTTIAAGILFWACAEPLFHWHQPPTQLGVAAASPAATAFSMSALFMHWTLAPYSIYTITGLVFAFSYYNLKQPFRISSLLFPLFGKKAHGTVGLVADNICLYALIVGMASSLGVGMLTLTGGLNDIFQIPQSNLTIGLVGLVIVCTFIASAASGLHKGIRWLSDLNTNFFILLAIVVLILGPTASILTLGKEGLLDFTLHFLPRLSNIQTDVEMQWQYNWTFFYLAGWFAWAPITALFLGRLSVGYNIRDFIHFTLLFPALFSGLWLIIFGGTALHFDIISQGELYHVLQSKGVQSVVYEVFNQLPFGKFLTLLLIALVFVSYVTAADSNISAMSAISSIGISPDTPEAPLFIKVIWGALIGLMAWGMTITAGVDGLKMLGVLGGTPAFFLIVLVALGLIKIGYEA